MAHGTKRFNEARGKVLKIAFRYIAVIFAVFLLGLTACSPENASETKSTDAEFTHTIYLVRHAEKQKGDNPGLTKAGKARALALKEKLQGESVEYIYSTNYRRTLETAGPLARHMNLIIRGYDPSDLESFARELTKNSGVYLVVGHSNTTPQLAEALGGGEAIYMPETEYDRFIEIKLGKDGKVLKSTSRFGARP